jgi:F-type H+-transporting ATPase subunit b
MIKIDIAQILTHVVGFLIVVWFVRRFAWDKLHKFIEHRRETIAASFSEIEKREAAVEAQKQRYEQELEGIEVARRSRIQDAAREAEKLAGVIREEARQETVTMREKAKQDIALEIDKANVVLKNRTVEAVFATVEKVLKEKLDRERHRRLIEDFLNQVRVD